VKVAISGACGADPEKANSYHLTYPRAMSSGLYRRLYSPPGARGPIWDVRHIVGAAMIWDSLEAG